MFIRFSEKKLLQVINICLYAALATPLVYSSWFLYPAIVPKAIFFRLVVTLALVAYALLVWRNQTWLPKVNIILASFGLFILWAFVASGFNSGFNFSFFDGFERMEGLLNYVYLFVFFVVAASTIQESAAWRALIRWAVVVSTFVAVYALLQVFDFSWTIPLAGERVTATMGNAGLLSGYLLLGIGLTWYLVGEADAKKLKAVYILLALIQLVALYFTQTRGAFLGLFVGLLAYMAGGAALYRGGKRIICGGLLVALAVGVVAIGVLYYQRGASIMGDDTIQNRLLVWRGSTQAMLERPLLGWGAGNFEVAFNAHYDPALSEIFFDHAHNSVLDMGVRFGLVGAVLYLLIFVVLLWSVWQQYRSRCISKHAGLALGVLLVAHFVHNFFLFDSLNSWVLLLVVAAYISSNTKEKNPVTISPLVAQISVAAVAIILLVFVWPYNMQPARSAYITSQAVKNISIDPYISVSYFSRTAEFTSLGSFDIAKRLSEGAVYAASSPGYNALTRNELFNLAEQANQDLIAQTPAKLRPRLNLASLYIYAGNNDPALLQKAEDILWQALNVAPKKFEARDLLAQVYIRQQRWEQAAAELEVVLSSNVRTGETYFLKGLVHIYLRDLETAQSALALAAEHGRVLAFPDYVVMARAYEANKYTEQAIAAYEQSLLVTERRSVEGVDFVNNALYRLYMDTGNEEKAAVVRAKINL